MFPKKFKTARPIDLLSIIKGYIIKNYDATCFDKAVENLLTEVQQNRNVICKFMDLSTKLDGLKANREILMSYINNLNFIKTKMSFGKDNYSIKVEFEWKDIFKNSSTKSYNIGLEYYSNLFNLGVMHFLMGKLGSEELGNDEGSLKENISNYQIAAWIFETIQNEASTQLPPNDLPIDLSNEYMSFLCKLSLALAQVNLIEVAKKKKMNFDLLAQLYQGISDLMKYCSILLKDSLKKYTDDQTKGYINYAVGYYQALAFKQLAKKDLEEFNKTGKNYGRAIKYMEKVVTCLGDVAKDLEKSRGLFNKKDEIAYSSEKAEYEKMQIDNKKIYYCPIPDNVDAIAKKIMSKSKIPTDFKTNFESSKELDALIPREAKEMITEYKDKMMNFVTENLGNVENETTIKEFLEGVGLPASLETVLSSSGISDSIWKKVSDTQIKGGVGYLNNLVATLDQKPPQIDRRLTTCMMLLKNEDDEDNKLRGIYGSDWKRNKSSELNFNYINTINDYKFKLQKAMECDAKTKNDLIYNTKNFDILSLSREQLDQRIPKKIDSSIISKSQEAVDLRKELDNLEEEEKKITDAHNKIFNSISEDNVTSQFLDVLQKKTTASAVFDQNKEKYQNMIDKLKNISENICSIKEKILTKNEAFVKLKTEKFKPEPVNEKFFQDLDSFCNIFRQKEYQLQKGLEFYKQFEDKLAEINRNVTDFLYARDLDKNEMIKKINEGNAGGSSGSAGSSVNTGNVPPKNISEQNMVNMNKNYYDFTNNEKKPNENNSGQPQSQYLYGQPQQNMFGQPQQNTFGQPQQNMFGQPQQNTFGQPQQNTFGQPQQNMFGQPQQNKFGQPQQNMFGQPQQNMFGQPQQNMYGQPQQNMYGQPQQNMYGQPQQNMYGQPLYGQNNQYGSNQPQFQTGANNYGFK